MRTQQRAVGIERPRPTAELHFELMLVIPVEYRLGDRAIVVAENNVDGMIADPVDGNALRGLRCRRRPLFAQGFRTACGRASLGSSPGTRGCSGTGRSTSPPFRTVGAGSGFGLVGDVAIGIVGALIGDWRLHRLGVHLSSGVIGLIINTTIGAIVLLLVLRVMGASGWGGR